MSPHHTSDDAFWLYNRVGARLHFIDHPRTGSNAPPVDFSLLVDAGYVGVTDTSTVAAEELPLKLHGLTVRALAQLRL